ncbi:group I intron-associated PD-(D/E)XK endonuclease [Halorussus gelatinilyticus]|uniref:Group I intron-associated PD-(D/E)XK endonuclease n=1 Tax=Halorussus gelatinilyticus TaxID=2937524 RepID=A0A8U0IMB9_9EURY|nr:group I intron-associated PD-(D/E)XK endonuclease [Halorussus gelatinilyticus]UPW02290.1 group I intron-associated PD-(D/E)XK endonuclease [Halorussus gelatinilyticus]
MGNTKDRGDETEARVINGEYRERTYYGEVDAFVVRYPASETLYRVEIDEANEQKMELRFDSEIDHPSINWAKEYELDRVLP